MSSRTSNRLVQTLQAASNRHAHTIAPPLVRLYGTSTLLSQRFSPKAPTPFLRPVPEEIHIRKKRRYSSQAASRFRHDETRWVELEQGQEGRRVKLGDRRGETQSAGGYARGDDTNEEGSGIIVMSNRHNFRDKYGRPWSKDTQSAPSGAGALGVGVGVSIPSTSKTKRKPRVELRDLTVKPKKKKLEPWQSQKAALERKFGETGWNPRKKLSPDAMDGIRALHEEDPERWSTPVLAEHFKVSPEAIRRILKSKWKPKDEEEMQKRRERWARRHDRIWDHQAELGLRPKRETNRDVEDPDLFDEELRAKEMLDIARKA